jgi:hypothetical protein
LVATAPGQQETSSSALWWLFQCSKKYCTSRSGHHRKSKSFELNLTSLS